MTHETGGAAFPTIEHWKNEFEQKVAASSGMTLRDWFAGQALAGLMANPNFDPDTDDDMAGHAYAQAEFMLEERKRI